MSTSLLYPEGFLSPLEIDDAVHRTLAEDLGRAGDVTSIATIPAGTVARAALIARKGGTISGLPLVAAAFRKLDPAVELKPSARDGDTVATKTALMTITGDARAVLSAERAALNLLGHLSGIASATAEFVRRVQGTRTRICCTRKTTPGLRALQKYAVRCGGGVNHRFSLSDMAMVKDNHVVAAGGVVPAYRAVREAYPELAVEVEVTDLDQLRELLDAGCDRILLDNMDSPTMAEAVRITAGRATLEASGGLTFERAREVAETGVDFISVGALTHSVKVFDLGMDLQEGR